MPFSPVEPNKMVPEIIAKTAGFPLNNGQVHGESTLCMTKQKATEKYVLSGAQTAPFANNQLLPQSAWVAGNCAFSANFVSVETLPTLISSIAWNKSSYPTTVAGCYVVSTTDPTPQGWAITNNNYTIRYNIADASNCGGTCPETQTGTATATITVGPSPVFMYIYFEGMGEAQDSNFERITFTLNGTLVSKANAPGGGQGCTMGPVVKQFIVAQPYALAANSVHTLAIDFTTADPYYHIKAYYEINLSFNT